MKYAISFALALVALLAPPAAHADPARRVYVGTYLHDVTAFDQRSGTYDVDMDVWAKWFGEFDPNLIRLQNAAGDVTSEDLGKESDGEWHAQRWRVRGTLRSEFPLQRFPFDSQKLVVVFELPNRRADLVPDLAGSGMAEHFSITGWDYDPHFVPTIAPVVYTSDLGTFENEGGSTRTTRVAFGVTLHRPPAPSAVKLFLPLVLLLVISLVALYLGPELVDPRASIGVTVLLACFAFQFTVAGTIPDVAYLTIVDSLFIVAYALFTIVLIISIVVYWVHRHGKLTLAHTIDKVARVVIPTIAIALAVAIVKPPASHGAAARPHVANAQRTNSERNVVHVGALALATATGGVIRGATQVGLVRTDSEGNRVPGLADQVPDVSNDMLTFGADGSLAVTWHLRPNTRWSDGHPLTSRDFAFALEVSPDPTVRSVETPDDRTLVVTYEDVLGTALDGFEPLPRHALEATFREGGYDAVRNARRTTILPTAGPYRLAEFVAEDHAVLVANPHYFDAAPAIGRVEIRRFADSDALVAAFRGGQVDIIGPNTLSPEEARTLEAAQPGSTVQRASQDLLALVPDLGVPLLAQLPVRRAILQAIDRAQIAQQAYGEYAFVALSPVPGIPPDPNEAQPFDAAAAHAELEAAGLLGSALTIVHSSRPMERRIAASIADFLRTAGLVVTLREQAAGQGGNANTPSGGLRLQVIRNDEEADPRRYWNLERRDGRFVDDARTTAYDDDVAGLVFRFNHALYSERRSQLRERSASEVAGRLPILPILFSPEIAAAAPTLQGWHEGDRFGATVADWHFAPPSNVE